MFSVCTIQVANNSFAVAVIRLSLMGVFNSGNNEGVGALVGEHDNRLWLLIGWPNFKRTITCANKNYFKLIYKKENSILENLRMIYALGVTQSRE